MNYQDINQIEASNAGWLPLEQVRLHYATQWNVGPEHALCNLPCNLRLRNCKSLRCRSAGTAARGIKLLHDPIEQLASHLGLTVLAKISEESHGPYALIGPIATLLRFATYGEVVNWLLAAKERSLIAEVTHNVSKALLRFDLTRRI